VKQCKAELEVKFRQAFKSLHRTKHIICRLLGSLPAAECQHSDVSRITTLSIVSAFSWGLLASLTEGAE
jgi:hypothetical protein